MAEKIKINISKRDKSPEAPKKTTYRDRSPVSKEKLDNADLQGFIDKFKTNENNGVEERGRSKKVDTESEVVDQEAMDEMQKLMGFGGFGTTKNKKVEGTNVYGASKLKKSEYRQYMNREKGFNRSLSPTPQEKKQKR